MDLAGTMVDPALDARPKRARLLEDLLEHVVLVVTELDLLDLHLELVDLRRDLDVVDGRGPERITRQLGDRVVVEGERLIGVGDDRALVGRDDVFVAADADEERGSLAGHDHDPGFLAADRGDGVRALDLAKRALHRPFEVAVVEFADQVDEHLGVGLALEDVALFGEPGPEGLVVLDDSVVDDRDAVPEGGVVAMRMRIRLRHATMGRPPGVGDADGTGKSAVLGDRVFEDANPSHALHEIEGFGFVPIVAQDRHARRVVSPILKPLQPFQQDGGRFTMSDVRDDATHGRLSPVRGALGRVLGLG